MAGLLFLNADTKTADTMVTGLRKMQEGQDVEVPPLRHAVALTSLGFLFPTGDLARMLQISTFVVGFLDPPLTVDLKLLIASILYFATTSIISIYFC